MTLCGSLKLKRILWSVQTAKLSGKQNRRPVLNNVKNYRKSVKSVKSYAKSKKKSINLRKQKSNDFTKHNS